MKPYIDSMGTVQSGFWLVKGSQRRKIFHLGYILMYENYVILQLGVDPNVMYERHMQFGPKDCWSEFPGFVVVGTRLGIRDSLPTIDGLATFEGITAGSSFLVSFEEP